MHPLTLFTVLVNYILIFKLLKVMMNLMMKESKILCFFTSGMYKPLKLMVFSLEWAQNY